MTIQQMHQGFMLELDKSNALEYPDFLPEEIDYWLNKAIREFVKTRYDGYNVKKKGFEETQKRIDDLRELVVEDQMIPVIDPDNTSYLDDVVVYDVDITTTSKPYWFSLGEEVAIEYTDCNGNKKQRRQFTTETTLNEYAREIQNPFAEFRLEAGRAKPLRLFAEDKVQIITDGQYVPILYYFSYLRQPAEVSITSIPTVDCDLASHCHDEIISLATNLCLENIESKRTQINAQLLNKQE